MPTTRARSVDVRNPATGAPAGSVPATPADDVAAVVATARAAQPAWQALGFDGRKAILDRWRDWLVEHRDRVLDALVAESGKTRDDAVFTDWAYIVDSLSFWGAHAEGYLDEDAVHPSSPFLFGRRMSVRYAPRGVVGVIGPWNFPLAMCLGDGIPALAAGNAVVLKPATLTPLSSAVAAEGFTAVGGPDGVLTVLAGGGTGPALVDAADMIMFTGSTETGRDIARRAANTLTPVSLELGGNDPMVVLADADLDRAANAAMHFGMFNAGQVCQSVERIYVEQPVYEPFVAKLTAAVEALRQGAPAEPGTVDVGALTDPDQLDVIDEHVRQAVEGGARVTTGGARLEGEGLFFQPTVLADCSQDMRVMQEETFGPVVAVMAVDDADEAVRLANDSEFGLSASVFTADGGAGLDVARRIEAGGVYVNDALLNGVAFEAPFGGWKSSGMGSRGGADGIRKYCRPQLLGIADLTPEREIYYYPTDPARSSQIEKLLTALQTPVGRAVGGALALVGRTPAPRVLGAVQRRVGL